jgi:hypothetical protein
MAAEQWYLRVLEFFRSIVALPTLVEVFTSLRTDNKHIIGIATGIALLVALALRCFGIIGRNGERKNPRQILSTTVPWVVTGVLVFVLIFVVSPRRAQKQGNLLATSWLDWQRRLDSSAGQCGKLNQCKNDLSCRNNSQKVQKVVKDVSACLAQNLNQVVGSRPRPNNATDLTGKASDLLAGQLLLADENTRDILYERLSLGPKFTGTGTAEPNSLNSNTRGRVSEFFVPNLPDTSPRVWVWKLDRGTKLDGGVIGQKTLKDVLLKIAPVNHADFATQWDTLQQQTNGDESRRIMVRFAELAESKYSGCLGRPTATRVFTIPLEDVADKTVQTAEDLSGLLIPHNSDDPRLKLFIWVYAPMDSQQEIPATWGNVLDNFLGWITDETCHLES